MLQTPVLQGYHTSSASSSASSSATCSTLLHRSCRSAPVQTLHALHATPEKASSFNQITDQLSRWYGSCLKIKCPFFRRRTTDSIEQLQAIATFFILRHKSTPLIDFILRASNVSVEEKIKGVPIADVAALVCKDWGVVAGSSTGKGYYINGRLTKEIYREDCLFDGPDPDMPVHGLRKYLTSASQLFDAKTSRADIIAPVLFNSNLKTIEIKWRIEGILKLPWKPFMKPWTGSTTYYLDEDNLIYKHIEQWDIAVWDAFLSTLIPRFNFGSPPAPPVDQSILNSIKIMEQ